MDLESLLIELGKSNHLGKLQLDSSGICTLLINDNYLITFEKSLENEGFFLYSNIGMISPEKEREISLMALKGNLFGKETGQASIGYVEESSTLVLFEYFDINNIDYPQFSQRFDAFLKHMFYWIMKLESTDFLPSSSSMKKEVPQTHVHKKIFYA